MEGNKKIYLWGAVAVVAIVIIPGVLGWIIPKESLIPGFEDSNDWIGFFGSYAGAIVGGGVTLLALWFTRKDTRDIQNENKILQQKLINLQERVIEIEEENQLKDSRTIYSEGAMKDNLTLESNKEFFQNNYILNSEHYNNILNTVKVKEEEEKLGGETSVNARVWLQNLRQFNKLNYKILKNVGGNNMYNIAIRLTGEWHMEDNSRVKDNLNFCLDCIENGRSILIPSFKLDDTGLNIVQFGISEMRVVYETGMINKRERITIDTKYNTNDKKANRKITIDKINNYGDVNFNFTEYSVIR
ncbi:hypothetical protein [Paraclostridium bifermentans]|uniref:hypothetical protein n=1 Tax=Paraclostridium bifermentans TaxID=1490 RepID=UPI0024BB045A|nr:hypothetical protein [Paraclostridium bifermentans]